jgi:nitroimidazol reductase NimA-like FMN-containing flavoprotein (pyridoxamine 5'-phosphate oxidase superfamily)
VARVAVVLSGGRPHVTPVLYAWDGETLQFSTRRRTLKMQGLQPGAWVSVTIDEESPPWRGVLISGAVDHLPHDAEWAAGALSRYVGEGQARAYADYLALKEPDRVRISVRPASIASWNQGKALARVTARFPGGTLGDESKP